jgi:hypothetical protein
MFRPDVFMVEALGLLVGKLHDFSGAISESFVHQMAPREQTW